MFPHTVKIYLGLHCPFVAAMLLRYGLHHRFIVSSFPTRLYSFHRSVDLLRITALIDSLKICLCPAGLIELTTFLFVSLLSSQWSRITPLVSHSTTRRLLSSSNRVSCKSPKFSLGSSHRMVLIGSGHIDKAWSVLGWNSISRGNDVQGRGCLNHLQIVKWLLMTSSHWAIYQLHLLSKLFVWLSKSLACSRSFGSLSINWKVVILFAFIQSYYLEAPILCHLLVLLRVFIIALHVFFPCLLLLLIVMISTVAYLSSCISLPSVSLLILTTVLHYFNFLTFNVSVGHAYITTGYFINFKELILMHFCFVFLNDITGVLNVAKVIKQLLVVCWRNDIHHRFIVRIC